MSQLCVYLPPFSSDYSGVCSCLFDLNGMVIIHDASCCSRNYVSYDEPRWFGNKRPIFCSGLREIDAILGDDDKFINKVLAACESMKPEFIALLGSPVPMIIGTDLDGIAQEMEERTGLPVFGFNTTGFRYYNVGAAEAMLKLAAFYGQKSTQPIPSTINILGLTTLDFSDNSNAADIRNLFEENGFKVLGNYMVGCSLPDIQKSAQAEVNVVVTQSGMPLAAYMEKEWGIPYVAATPLGYSGSVTVLRTVKQVCADRKSQVIHAEGLHDGEVLILGEQLIANSLRNALANIYGVKGVTVGCLFGLDKALAQDFDIDIRDERQIRDLIASGHYRKLVADPLLEVLIKDRDIAFFSLPHVAVSSKLYWHRYRTFIGAEMETFIAQIAKTPEH
ncbi:MAG: nitrogenase component 1 [Desulfosporosinus sp.]|nr:nitrogenase component 1 [Desulfosporosinus sp.]